MDASNEAAIPWGEEDSRQFIERGHIVTPMRDEIRDTILDLIPAEPDAAFFAMELGVGAGWLIEAVLARFPAARVLGFDGSPTMLHAADARLQPFAGRFTLRPFRLEDRSWLTEVGHDVRCFVSSLVIHHLDAAGKQALYRDLYAHLAPEGAVLIADLVAPASERERRYMAQRWDAEVERQSLAMTGSDTSYRAFVDGHENWYTYPDPVDMPSTVAEHIAWLTVAGFVGADVFWARAGHAIYGGYKPGTPGEQSGRLVPATESQQRVMGLHAGAMRTSDDLDAPLPDESWAGS